MSKKLEEMTLEELRVAYTDLMTAKEKSDLKVTELEENNTKLVADNKQLQLYNNQLFAKIPNLNPEHKEEVKDEPKGYDKLLEELDNKGGIF